MKNRYESNLMDSENATKFLIKKYMNRNQYGYVIVHTLTGAVKDFELSLYYYAKDLQSHIANVTGANCGGYRFIEITKIIIDPKADDITIKMLAKTTIQQMQAANTILFVRNNSIFDERFFNNLGFTKMIMKNITYHYWINNSIKSRMRIELSSLSSEVAS